MADTTVAITPGSGALVDAQSLTNGSAQTVMQQTVTIGDGATAGRVAALTTKGTQGSVALVTQAMKDSGRTAVILSASAIASVAAETAVTLNQWKTGVATSVSTYTVTTGKTLSIQAIQFGLRFATPSTTVTFATMTYRLRVASSGTATVTSPLLLSDSKMAASNLATPNSDLTLPDGMELGSGYSLMLTQQGSAAATLLIDALIVGYEY